MSQVKNFISGSGRLNRRQFVVMFIATGFCLWVFSLLVNMILLSLLGEENFIISSVFVGLFLEIFVWFPFALAYFIRRGHDFSLKTFISATFVILILLLRVIPGIWVLLWPVGNFLGLFNLVVILIYIFYPGSKTTNIYGNVPPDFGKPSKIFRYMKTGSWENKKTSE